MTKRRSTQPASKTAPADAISHQENCRRRQSMVSARLKGNRFARTKEERSGHISKGYTHVKSNPPVFGGNRSGLVSGSTIQRPCRRVAYKLQWEVNAPG